MMMTTMKRPFRLVHNIAALLCLIAALIVLQCEGFTVTPSTQHPASLTNSRTSAIFVPSYRQGAPLVVASTVIEEETTTTKKEKTTIEIIKDSDLEDQQDNNRDGWEIRLWNDPFNKREFVARCLSAICNKSDTESYQIMMQAHKNGYV
jgi:ATP-dependent Clp protease adapter protein ClpS